MNVVEKNPELLDQRLRQAHRAAITAELAAEGLQEIGHPMLVTILESTKKEGEGCCYAQRELAELLNISPAAVATSLKSLEKAGYIQRTPVQGDARRNQVALTEKGQLAVEGCKEAIGRVNRQMTADFTPQEMDQLRQFHRRMLANLMKQNESPMGEGKDG